MFENVDPLDGVLRYLRALRLSRMPHARHPDKMFPCIESYGILVTDLGRKISDYLYERGQCGHLVQSDSVRINIFISAYI